MSSSRPASHSPPPLKEWPLSFDYDKNYQATLVSDFSATDMKLVITYPDQSARTLTYRVSTGVNDALQSQNDFALNTLIAQQKIIAERKAAQAVFDRLVDENLVPSTTAPHFSSSLCRLLTSTTILSDLFQRAISFDALTELSEPQVKQLLHPAYLQLLAGKHCTLMELTQLPPHAFDLLCDVQAHYLFTHNEEFAYYLLHADDESINHLIQLFATPLSRNLFNKIPTDWRKITEFFAVDSVLSPQMIHYAYLCDYGFEKLKVFIDEIAAKPVLADFIAQAIDKNVLHRTHLTECDSLEEAACRHFSTRILRFYTNQCKINDEPLETAAAINEQITDLCLKAKLNLKKTHERILELVIRLIYDDIAKKLSGKLSKNEKTYYCQFTQAMDAASDFSKNNVYARILKSITDLALTITVPAKNILPGNTYSFFETYEAVFAKNEMLAFKQSISQLSSFATIDKTAHDQDVSLTYPLQNASRTF